MLVTIRNCGLRCAHFTHSLYKVYIEYIHISKIIKI